LKILKGWPESVKINERQTLQWPEVTGQKWQTIMYKTLHIILDWAKQTPHKSGGEFMCSGNIAVLSLLAPHKSGGEFMCSGKIAVLSLLAPHKSGGEFMCSGKIAFLSLLVAPVVLLLL
jgi:hypothetical protein